MWFFCRAKKQESVVLLFVLVFVLCSVSSGKYSGGTGEPNNPYLIATPNDLNSIGLDSNDWDKHFLMTADINLADITGSRFNLIGNNSKPFTGVFDGNGHSISNLSIECDELNEAGLFGRIGDANASVENLTLLDPNINAHNTGKVGALVGFLNYGIIRNCGVRGGSVSGGTGGGDSTGGLVGGVIYGLVLSSHSNTSVNGYYNVGGLVGLLISPSSILSDCYATGVVFGNSYVGGLVGFASGSKVYNCYAAALVSSNVLAGGFTGQSDGSSYYECFWDRDVDTEVNAVGGWAGPEPLITGLPTPQMQMRSTFADAGWDMVNIWDIGENQTYPFLRKHLPSDINKDNETNFYDLAILAENWLKEK